MNLENILNNEPIDVWLNELKPYQATTITEFLKSMTPEEAAQKWITANGTATISNFGGQSAQNLTVFWNNFKIEVKKFICNDTAYEKEKTSLISASPITKTALVSAMSSAIGSQLGASATLLAPALVVLLFIIGSMGKNAYCSMP